MSDDPKPYNFTTDEGHYFSGVDGEMHSVNDEPAVIYKDGTKWWYRNGKIHRDNGPAVVWWNGVEEWWQNNERHREDGPALVYPSNPGIHPALRGKKQWWVNGKLIKEV